VWVVTHVTSQSVGRWTLLWRVASWLLMNGPRNVSETRASVGRASLSSPGTGQPNKIVLLAAHSIANTSGARRWQLTCEWGQWQALAARRNGPSSVPAGRWREADGEETLHGQVRPAQTLMSGTTLKELLNPRHLGRHT